MPAFEVTAPDGRKFRVNGPDGSTQDDAVAFVQSKWTASDASASPPAPAAAPKVAPNAQRGGYGGSRLNGVLQGIADPFIGAT